MVLLAAVLLVAVPVAVRNRPAGSVPEQPVADVLARVQGSGGVGWSGRAESTGSLQLPESDSFATLGQLHEHTEPAGAAAPSVAAPSAT